MPYDALSLFSGAGGFCEGARLAGFRIRGAVENDRFAVETYRQNFPEVELFDSDIEAFLNPEDSRWPAEAQRFAHLEERGVDLVFGGPPCQGYSQIGTRLLDDPRNRLYSEFVRVLEAVKPRVFLMENVPNMLLLAKGVFADEALAAFREAGYANCAVTTLWASDYGVPQARQRAIFLGVRDDCDLGMDALDWLEQSLEDERKEPVTVRQAIGDLPGQVSLDDSPLPYPSDGRGRHIEFRSEMRLDRDGEWYAAAYKQEKAGTKQLHNHHTKQIQQRRADLIAMLKPGRKADSLPPEVWNGARPEKWRRFHPDKQAHTLLAQMHRDLSEWIHYRHPRWITVREAARLQSFHDGFVFKSSEWQMLKQIGNAVPPLMGRAIASSARRALERLDERARTADEAA